MPAAVMHYGGRAYPVDATETVLDVLLRLGVNIPYSCRQGVCLACLLRCERGSPPPMAQLGLGEALTRQGYFLACKCPADTGLEIAAPSRGELFIPAIVREKSMPTADICRLLLQPEAPLDYRPGQFVNLRRADDVVRSYSLASDPRDGIPLELHVQRRRNGVLSNWLIDDLRVGDTVEVQGPNGEGYYRPGQPDAPLLMIGTGTGLAPLLGVTRDALAQGHRGPIHFYHGSRDRASSYGRDWLLALAERHANVQPRFCLADEHGQSGFHDGLAQIVAFAQHTDLRQHLVFLSGAPAMVHSAARRARFLGARPQDIHADPFENRELRRIARRAMD